MFRSLNEGDIDLDCEKKNMLTTASTEIMIVMLTLMKEWLLRWQYDDNDHNDNDDSDGDGDDKDNSYNRSWSAILKENSRESWWRRRREVYLLNSF